MEKNIENKKIVNKIIKNNILTADKHFCLSAVINKAHINLQLKLIFQISNLIYITI